MHGQADPDKFYPPTILKRLYTELQLGAMLKAGQPFSDELKLRLRRATCLEWETVEFCLKKARATEERQANNKVLDALHDRSGMMASVRVYVWCMRPALAPNPSASASKEPWSNQKHPDVAARMAREGSCTVPQMQEVLTKELGVRKSVVPRWKAQCVEKIFELAKLSTQQATLPAVVAAAAPAAAPAATAAAPPAAAAIAAAAAAAAAAVQAEHQADEALAHHVEQQRAVAAAAELEEGDKPDTARGDEPIEPMEVADVEVADVEEDGEVSDEEGDAADQSESTTSTSEAEAVVEVLQQLMEEAQNDPESAADMVLLAPSIWRCCSSGAKTAAWKCGSCNLWTHRTCQKRACGADRANPLCKACFEAAAVAAREEGPRKRARAA